MCQLFGPVWTVLITLLCSFYLTLASDDLLLGLLCLQNLYSFNLLLQKISAKDIACNFATSERLYVFSDEGNLSSLKCQSKLFKYNMKNILAPESLIKYEPSVQIFENMKAYHQQKSKKETNQSAPKLEEIIDSILPPRDWTDHNNKLHIQYVSHQPSSRKDVEELTQHLDKMLEDRQAKKTGICPIREELYSQALDEIIRQVAVDCPQRGLLFMRVRDEHKMTLAAYQTIYQSSIAYGMRKQVQSEIGNDTIQQEYSSLCKLKQQLQTKKSLLLCKKDLLQKQIRENKAMETEKREEELRFLKLQRENMSKFLQAVKSQFHSIY